MIRLLFLFTAVIMFIRHTDTNAQNPAILRGPYLNIGTSSSIVVRWRTDTLAAAVNSRVRYGTQMDTSAMMTVDSANLTFEHEINITGLIANTKYYYAIGTSASILSGPDSSMYFQTSPTAGTKQPIRVWAIGDFGEGNANQAAVRDAYKNYMNNQHTDVWIWLGDNAYNDGYDSEYQTSVFDMYPEIFKKTVLWPAPGNHDYGSTHPLVSTGGVTYFNNFTMPINGEAGGAPSGNEGYYSYNYGNVHFISLNSENYTYSGIIPNVVITHSPAMITWLQSDLAANTNKDWIIAYLHAPPYANGTHSENYNGIDIFKKLEGIVMRSVRDNIVPILESYGADLFLGGHSHDYERSYLIYGNYGTGGPYPPDSTVVDGSSGKFSQGTPYTKLTTGPGANKGTVYAVVGCSAKTGNYTDDGPLTHELMFTGDYRRGSLMLEINDKRLDAYFIDTSGSVFDDFTIIKDPVTPPSVQETDINSRGFKVYPNPFTGQMTVEYTLDKPNNVLLDIYNLAGQKVHTVVNKYQQEGNYTYTIDADKAGLVKGSYLLEFKIDGISKVRKSIKL